MLSLCVLICYVSCRCLTDCGSDAHSHVSHCRASLNAGGVYGTQQQFNAVHSQRRRGEVLHYINTAVPEVLREEVKLLIAKDVGFLGVNIR